MNILILVAAIVIALATAASLYRLAAGPTVFDRVLVAGLIGTNGFILVILIGFIYGRIEMFIDIALTYALLNFIGIVVLGKYFERNGGAE
ncbi:MAG: hypothetical protein HYX91_03585 [Chloroflexi bacterium]|nr:hypothetical protein [Chloroflexota bacterium]